MSLTLAGGPVQQAVYELLSAADIVSAGKAVPVLDYAPENQPFPFITLADPIEGQTDILTTRGRTLMLTVNIWSRYRGWFEIQSIREQVVASLDRQQAVFDAPGLSVWRCAVSQAHGIMAADGYTRQGVVEFLIDVQEA